MAGRTVTVGIKLFPTMVSPTKGLVSADQSIGILSHNEQCHLLSLSFMSLELRIVFAKARPVWHPQFIAGNWLGFIALEGNSL